jgi:phosphopantetheinyl transferase
MPKKQKVSASKTAEKLAEMALKHLSQYSEEEQEERISKAERTVATFVRAGISRTLSSTPRNPRTRVSSRGR